jgi:stage II sporulation protein D
MKKYLVIFLLGFLNLLSQTRPYIYVRILSNQQILRFTLTVTSGKYQLLSNSDTLFSLSKDESITILARKNKLLVVKQKDTLYLDTAISIVGKGFVNIFDITTEKIHRFYDDHLIVKNKKNTLWLLNQVKIDNYIASVVESEAGVGKEAEFLKAHTIITRTYTLKNINKHADEGFNLCDQTHCQVYKGRCTRPDILIAAMQTHDLVLVDNANQLALSVYHSNSGGETMSASQLWGKNLPYLPQKKDSFSIGQKNYAWEKRINKQEWLTYLKKNYNYPVDNPDKVKLVLSFSQPSRKTYLVENIPLKKIREDWKLRSTFFDIIEEDETVLFKGKGFGHGVGFSQEGAIQMAKMGFTFEEILQFYYPDTKITRVDKLNLNIFSP